MIKTILVVDDERSVRFSLQSIFEPEYTVLTAENGEQALKLAEEQTVDLAICDLMMPGLSGLELLPKLRAVDPQITTIVLSAMNDIPSVVEAIRLGAVHYLTKPFDVSEVRLLVEMALRDRGRAVEMSALESDILRWYDVDDVVGNAPAWTDMLAMAGRAAQAGDTTVLFLGESGTGKELLARWTHRHSPRANAPFIPIHCAAIPEALLESELFGHEKGSFTGATERRRGCIETADGGTLLLDEIGEMPMHMQTKLLRFLQDHRFTRVGGRVVQQADVRIVAATNRDLHRGVSEGWFREDLFYRLNVVPIRIPPLRERVEDVARLVRHFLGRFQRERHLHMGGVSAEAMGLMQRYAWPGNVRELRNLIERIVVLHGDADTLQPEHLPPEVRGEPSSPPVRDTQRAQLPVSLEAQVAELECDLIGAAMAEADGNLSRAAVLLQTTRRKLKYKMDLYGLSSDTAAPPPPSAD